MNHWMNQMIQITPIGSVFNLEFPNCIILFLLFQMIRWISKERVHLIATKLYPLGPSRRGYRLVLGLHPLLPRLDSKPLLVFVLYWIKSLGY